MNAKRTLIASSLAALFLVVVFSFHVHVLRVEAVREQRTVFVHIVRPNDTFSTAYVHSVELSPVREYFRIDADFRIVLYETHFSSCNTGLPTILSGGERFSHDGDHFRIFGMARVVPVLDLWVDAQYDNTLQMGGDAPVNLPALAGNTLLRVAVAEISFFEFICLKTNL